MCRFDPYRTWWADLPSRHAPGTVRRWRYLVHRAMADLGRPAETITRAELRRYLDEFRPATANQYRLALTDFFAYLVREGQRAENPLNDEPSRRLTGMYIRRGLEPDEFVRLAAALAYLPPRFPWLGQRIAMLATAHVLTGVRPGELLKLTTDRIHLNGSSSRIEVVGTKTGEDRLVPLSPAAHDVFTELVRDRQGRIANIGTTRYHELIHRAAVYVGLPNEKARPYALRHTFATWALDAGADERVVANILGHRDLRYIQRYTVPSDDLRREAVGRLGRV